MEIRKTLSLDSAYSIDGAVIAMFNASIELGTGEYQIFSNINDQKVYRKNRETIDDAYTAFQDEVYKIVDEVAAGDETY